MTTFTAEVARLAIVRRLVRDGSARRIREAASVSRLEVARTLGITVGAVAHWERGRREPRDADLAGRYLDMLRLLARIAGVEVIPKE